MARAFSRSLATFVLFVAMAVSLPITMAGEAVALAFNGGAIGNEAGTAADVFGWVFAAAFVAAFVLSVAEQERRFRAGYRSNSGARSGH